MPAAISLRCNVAVRGANAGDRAALRGSASVKADHVVVEAVEHVAKRLDGNT